MMGFVHVCACPDRGEGVPFPRRSYADDKAANEWTAAASMLLRVLAS